MRVNIKHLDGHLLITAAIDHRGLIGLEGADLRGADLKGVVLAHERLPTGCHVDARGEYAHGMVGWRLDGADLTNADLSGADARLATFYKTTLTDAKFDGARLPWCSHDVVSELLRQAATAEPDRLPAHLTVLSNRTWNWEDILRFDGPHENWSLEVLRRFVQPGDIVHPCLRPDWLKPSSKDKSTHAMSE